MKSYSLNTLREMYLSFFEEKGHLRHESFPLVPINDKSILLINAGMTPLKKYFTGESEPPCRRMTTCQKCIRTPDIERVGITARHGTFFEMLGNFSFGNYFKKEAISWAWEFITERLELPVDRLWVTIYLDDDEAYDIWSKDIGVSPDKIVRLGKEDNFWEHGSGPCGPCSEIHFDRGEEFGCGSPDCKPGCDCDRFMEFWNLVFTQFDGDGAGNYTPLSNPNIDTGMGLERLACLMQGVNSLFEVDTVKNIMNAVSKKSGVAYGDSNKTDISLRIITDHIRSTSFLVCDGVVPSNEGRGYVLRRLIRRAARHGRLIGIKGTFLSELCAVVAGENKTAYPELTTKLDYIQKVVSNEEKRFAETIDSGLSILDEMITKAKENSSSVLDGADVFKLSDTYGFSIDLTREIACDAGLSLDEAGFDSLLTEQKQRARAARAAMGDLGWVGDGYDFISGLEKTEFVGYTDTKADGKILAIADEGGLLGTASEGSRVLVVLDKTPFYGEGGGQVGDAGRLYNSSSSLIVTDTKKHDGVFIHVCEIESGSVSVGDALTAEIDGERRMRIARNHSACHLLQAALRTVLGVHVEQAGSYVDPERLRFDFSHFSAMTPEEIKKVEELVNTEILRGDGINTTETDVESAKKMGAMALFGEKYGSRVRVVKMGGFSCELCGGTHLDNTAKAGLFKIISESSVAAGVRRIEATTGTGVLSMLDERDGLIAEAVSELKINSPSELLKKLSSLSAELKAAKNEISAINEKMAKSQLSSIADSALALGNFSFISAKTSGVAVDALRNTCDDIKSKNPDAVIILFADCDGKKNFVAAVGSSAVSNGAHAGNILKEISAITGGRGGGRPDSAVAGVGDDALVDKAFEAAADILKSK